MMDLSNQVYAQTVLLPHSIRIANHSQKFRSKMREKRVQNANVAATTKR